MANVSYWILLMVTMVTTFLIQVVMGKDPDKEKAKNDKMITGVAAGAGFVVGLATLVITVWCCCCGNGCKDDTKRRVAPAEPDTRTSSVSS